LFVIIHADDG
jgi:3-oxoacyl-[acyl-carrier protein] reductase